MQAAAENEIGADLPVDINPLMQLVHDNNWVEAADMIQYMVDNGNFKQLEQMILTRSPNQGACSRRINPRYLSANSTLMHMMAHHKPNPEYAGDYELGAYEYCWEQVGFRMKGVVEIDVRQGFGITGKTPLMAAAVQNNVLALISLLVAGASDFRRVLGLLSD